MELLSKYPSTINILNEMSEDDKLKTMKCWLTKSIVFPYKGKATEVTFNRIDSQKNVHGVFWGPKVNTRVTPQLKRDLVASIHPGKVTFDLDSAVAAIAARESPVRVIAAPQRWQDFF